jgi:hypothetical protein
MTEQVDQNQRRLKRIVIGLGVLLVICFCIVVGTMAYRLSNPAPDVASKASPAASADALAALDITTPAGSRVINITTQGAHYLILMETGNGQIVQVVNRSDGTLVQTIRFTQAQ